MVPAFLHEVIIGLVLGDASIRKKAFVTGSRIISIRHGMDQ